MYYEYSFTSNPEIHFQGAENKLNAFLWNNPGLVQIGGGNGSYIFSKPSTAQIIEFVDRVSVNPIRTITPSLSFILTRRELRKVAEEKLYDDIREIDLRRLVEDLNSGRINVEDVY